MLLVKSFSKGFHSYITQFLVYSKYMHWNKWIGEYPQNSKSALSILYKKFNQFFSLSQFVCILASLLIRTCICTAYTEDCNSGFTVLNFFFAYKEKQNQCFITFVNATPAKQLKLAYTSCLSSLIKLQKQKKNEISESLEINTKIRLSAQDLMKILHRKATNG